jgi:hypothetical protein
MSADLMNPKQLILRCYAKQEKGLWVAVCLGFTLAVQAETLPDAKRKLEEQIELYVSEALNDKEYGSQLLSKSAPLSSWLEYYFIGLMSSVYHSASVIFSETIPFINGGLINYANPTNQ